MPELVIPRPNAKQKIFLNDLTHKWLAYGGARGGGKSWALQILAIIGCMIYAGLTVTLVRRSYPELRKNHIDPLCQLLQVHHPDRTQRYATYNDQKKEIRFRNGSRIIFMYCDSLKDSMRFQGFQTDWLLIDEATQLPWEWIVNIKACVRGVNDFPKLYRLGCNPGGPGMDWVKRLFVDRKYLENENPEDYAFIQALVTDNTELMRADPDYYNTLKSLPPKLRDAWLYGRWDVFEGSFFSEMRTDPDPEECGLRGLDVERAREEGRFTHVIAPIDLSRGSARGWRIYRSYDFGYAKPFSCAWWAVDYDGTLYRILELYGCTETPNEGVKWTPDQQFRKIREIEQEHPWLKGKHIEGVADPSIWDASRGESIADTAQKYGLMFLPGDNQRIPGWMQCHYRMQFDENGYSRFYVFDNCRAFLRTVPLMQYSRTNPEDLDTSLEDHVADEWRYMCMSQPVTPMRPVEKKVIYNDPLNQFTRR